MIEIVYLNTPMALVTSSRVRILQETFPLASVWHARVASKNRFGVGYLVAALLAFPVFGALVLAGEPAIALGIPLALLTLHFSGIKSFELVLNVAGVEHKFLSFPSPREPAQLVEVIAAAHRAASGY